jgi:hypothetical protein
LLANTLFLYRTSQYTEVSRPQFTGPSSGICPGDDVTFTCVVSTTNLTAWTVNSGGDETSCSYRRNDRNTDTCGPGGIFTSSVTDMNGDPRNSSLSVDSVTSGLSGTSVTCSDGNPIFIGSRNICVIDVLESSEFQSATVSGFGDMCQLSLEWSEAVVSCSGDVTYTVTATPCLSGSGDCEVISGSPVETFSTTESQITLSVDGSVGLEYDFTVSTCTSASDVYTVNLRANSSGDESFYYYVYDNVTLTIDVINVTWPRYYVLNSEASYRVVIDEETIDIVAADNCSEEICTYDYYPASRFTTPPPVAVDIVGCTTVRISPMNISSFCSPEDLLSPGVPWDRTPNVNSGVGVYSFPGGNVTYYGLSQGSTATYRTAGGFLFNGSSSLVSTCGADGWPEVNIANATCPENELLPCDNPTPITDNMMCCSGNSICARYRDFLIGSTATYTTSSGYCIPSDSPPERICRANLSRSGEIPTITEASPLEKLRTANVVLMVLGLLFFLAGVVTSIVVVVKTWPDGAAKEDGGNEAPKWCCRLCILSCCCPCWIRCFILMMLCPPLLLAIVLPVLEAILWIATFIYVGINDFTDDGGDYRNGNSLCKSPSGRNSVRDGLFVVNAIISFLIFLFWLGYYPAYLIYKKCCSKPQKTDSAEEPIEMRDAYDVIQRNPPPTQKLLSDVDPAYKKLEKRGAEEPAHYGKLDHAGKKTATVAPAVGDAEYGKLDRTQMEAVEPGHYGKLDHSGKKTNTLPVADPGSSEYGKLDRSQMEDPLHYGKLDHPGKRGATLPGGVAPTDTEGYGKLDNTQMQAGGSSARGGDMYDTVSHEPRHKVPSSKSKRQHSSSGEEASLL